MEVGPDLLLYMAEALLLGFLIGLVAARSKDQNKEYSPQDDKTCLPPAPGLEKAVAARFYRELDKATKSGRIKVALVSDECPQGYVAYDFVRGNWVCVETDGTVHPLGEQAIGEHVFFEEEESEGDR